MTKALPGDSKVGFWGTVKQVAKVVFYPPWVYTADAQAKNIKRQIESTHAVQESNQQCQREIEASRQQFELARLKAQHLMQLERQDFDAEQTKQNREFQTEQAKLSREFQTELTSYIQQCEVVRQQKRQDFEKFLLVERKKFDLEVQQRGHELQLKLAVLQGQIVRQTEQYKHILANYPWRLYPATILDAYSKLDPSKPVPPLVIISPPEVEFDRFPNRASKLPSMEKDLEEDLRIFLRDNYNPPNDLHRATKFVGGAWDTKRMRSETALDGLFSMLSTVPTIILESEVNDDFLNFRIASWDVGYSTYEYQPILSKFPYREFLYRIAQNYALEWKERKENLLAQGWKLGAVQELEQDNELNLQKWEYEQRLSAAGYKKPQDYKINRDCIQQLCRYLGILHCVFASLAIDEYYFLRYTLAPKLPEVLFVLIQGLPEYEVSNLIESVGSHYFSFCKTLENQGSSLVPELSMNLALAFTQLSEKSWAKKLFNYSICSWLKLRSSPLENADTLEEIIEAMKPAITLADRKYLDNIKEYLFAIDDKQNVVLVESLINIVENLISEANKSEQKEVETTRREKLETEFQYQQKQTEPGSEIQDKLTETTELGLETKKQKEHNQTERAMPRPKKSIPFYDPNKKIW